MKICLDAGHYKGYNQGKVKSYYEGDVMWKLTNLQKKYLEEYKNVEVILTRSNINNDLSLSSRGVKSRGCDLFISNHSNAVATESVDRPVIIYAYDNKNNAYDLGNKLGIKIKELMITKQNHQMMQRKGNSGEYYGVLRGARNAGCPRYYIIEHGFHTNIHCCNWLLNDSNLEKLAKAEVEVIAKYYNLQRKSTEITETAVNQEGLVNATSLNVRSGPGTNYSKIGSLKNNTKVSIVVKCSNNWLKIKYGSGYGYVSGDYIDNIKNISTKWKNGDYNCKVRATANLNLRSGRGTNYSIMHTIPKGTVFELGYVYNNWGSTWDFEGKVGYLCCDYIEKV